MGKGEMFVCAPSTLSGARRAKRREEERGLDLVCFRLETSSEVKVCSRLSSTRNCNCVARPSNPAQEQYYKAPNSATRCLPRQRRQIPCHRPSAPRPSMPSGI